MFRHALDMGIELFSRKAQRHSSWRMFASQFGCSDLRETPANVSTPIGLLKQPILTSITFPSSKKMSSDTEYVLQRFKHLGRRSILPLLPRPGSALLTAEAKDVPDLKNVQGDVIYLFPKVNISPDLGFNYIY